MILNVSFTLIMIIRKYRCYQSVKQLCLKHVAESVNVNWEEEFYQIKDNLRIDVNVKFVCSEYCKSPKSIGVFKPVVIFPIVMKENCIQRSYLMKHELVHIKYRDLLLKSLAILNITVHWFNPLSYLLYYEICTMSEIICDSKVLYGLKDHERIEYSNLLLRMSSNNESSDKFSIGIYSDYSVLKRRILEMKHKSKRKVFVSVITGIAICCVGGMTSFAYSPATEVDILDYEDNQNIEFLPDAAISENDFEAMPYDYFFVDKFGNISRDSVPYVICRHKFKDNGTIKKHSKVGGGCEVVYYEGWRCSLCGHIKAGDVIKTVSYTKCPH